MSASKANDSKPHNMNEIMAAIQKVLAEHDVGQARVVLELFDAADQQQQEQQGGSAGRQSTITVASSPLPPPERDGRHNPSPRPTAKAEGLLLPIDLHGEAPMRSPERQAPPPRSRSSSERCTHMLSGSSQTSPSQPPSLPPGPPPGSLRGEAVPSATALPATEPPPAPRNGSELPARHSAASNSAGEPSDVLDHTARPSDRRQSSDVPPVQHQEEEKGGLPEADAMAVDPSALLPLDLFQELSKQQSRAERVAVLKSFVGKSALLDDKKQREALKKQPPPAASVHAFLSQSRSTAGSGGSRPHTGGSLQPTPPQSRPISVRLSLPSEEATSAASPVAAACSGGAGTPRSRKTPHVPGKNPIFSILSKDSTLAEGGGSGGGVEPPVNSGRRPNSVSVRDEPPKSKSPLHRPVLGDAAMKHHPDSILRAAAAASPAPSSGATSTGQETREATAEVLPALPGGDRPHTPTPRPAPPRETALPALDRQTFTAASRENAQRAAQMRTGLSSPKQSARDSSGAGSTGRLPPRHLPGSTSTSTVGSTAGPAAGRGLGGSKALKDMLKEQQEMEAASQAALREHAATMEKARRFLQDVEANEKVKPHLDLLRAERAVDGAAPPRSPPMRSSTTTSSMASTSAAAGPTPPPKPTTDHDLATAAEGEAGTATTPRPAAPLSVSPQLSPRRNLGVRSSTSSSSGGAAGIQVVRFTMPTEPNAKESVVAQLSRSPAGQQHLTTKDLYAAMLAEQRQEIHENESATKTYLSLVERAVEFNEALRSDRGAEAAKK